MIIALLIVGRQNNFVRPGDMVRRDRENEPTDVPERVPPVERR